MSNDFSYFFLVFSICFNLVSETIQSCDIDILWQKSTLGHIQPSYMIIFIYGQDLGIILSSKCDII